MNTIKLPISSRIKELRKQFDLTQEELADKVDVDSKMISYYENNKSTPSVDVLIKIAEIFNVSIDYLLISEAPKRPLKQSGDAELFELITELDKLTDEDKNSMKHIIKSLITKNKVTNLVTKAG